MNDVERAKWVVEALYGPEHPRLSHIERVLGILREMQPFVPDDQAVAVVLHDTVEDGVFDLDSIEEQFGRQVALDVENLTEKPKRCRGDFMESVGYLRVTPRALEVRLAGRLDGWAQAQSNGNVEKERFYRQDYLMFKTVLQTVLYLPDYWVRLDALQLRRPEASWLNPATGKREWGIGFQVDKNGNPVVP